MKTMWLVSTMGLCSLVALGAVQVGDGEVVGTVSAAWGSSDPRTADGGVDLEDDARFWAALAALDHGVCSVICYMADCGENEHWAFHDGEPGQDEWDGGPHPKTDCRAEPCGWDTPGGRHPPCTVSQDQDEEDLAVTLEAMHLLDTAMTNGDVPLVARLIEAAPQKFRPNLDRSVLQVTPCGDNVVAQYTLSPEAMADLSGVWSRTMVTGE